MTPSVNLQTARKWPHRSVILLYDKYNYMDLVYLVCIRYCHTFRLFTSSEMCGSIEYKPNIQDLYSCAYRTVDWHANGRCHLKYYRGHYYSFWILSCQDREWKWILKTYCPLRNTGSQPSLKSCTVHLPLSPLNALCYLSQRRTKTKQVFCVLLASTTQTVLGQLGSCGLKESLLSVILKSKRRPHYSIWTASARF